MPLLMRTCHSFIFFLCVRLAWSVVTAIGRTIFMLVSHFRAEASIRVIRKAVLGHRSLHGWGGFVRVFRWAHHLLVDPAGAIYDARGNQLPLILGAHCQQLRFKLSGGRRHVALRRRWHPLLAKPEDKEDATAP